MEKRYPLLILLAALPLLSPAQNVRCNYNYFYKKDPAKGFYQVPDMRLDYYEGKSAWYSENSFLNDSLTLIAFDETGSISNNDAFSQLNQIRPKLFECTTVDFQTQSFIQHYQNATLRLNGKDSLTLPTWKLEDEEKELEGYHCHKATARYLGRDWTVWYTEEIPLNIGPWLLWGAPGLILDARDDDNLFVFKFTGVEILSDNNRFDLLRKCFLVPHNQKRAMNYTTDQLRVIENTYTKLRSDVSFFDEAHHIKGMLVRDANGREVDRSAYYKYIPLIPTEYWKTKK